MEIKKAGVLGCGLMGSGIAQVCAMAGFDVNVLEVEQKFLDKGFAGIERSLSKFAERPVEKGGITAEQKNEIQRRLKGTTSKADLADCDIVIEAIIENLEEKKKMYGSLEGIVKTDAIFASNTSSISITELLTATKRPERFIGLHFFNPVPLMKLVEVVRTIATGDDVYESAYAFAKKLGKVPVRTSDKTGFIVNRLLVPYLLDAIRAYEEGVGSIEDIDQAMKLGCGYPMGPFTLLDFVGLDTTYYITHVMYDESWDPVYLFSSWRHLNSPYGTLFSAITYPLGTLPLSAAYWIWKVIAVLGSLGLLIYLIFGPDEYGPANDYSAYDEYGQYGGY